MQWLVWCCRENQAQAEHRHNTLLNSYRNACGLEQDIK